MKVCLFEELRPLCMSANRDPRKRLKADNQFDHGVNPVVKWMFDFIFLYLFKAQTYGGWFVPFRIIVFSVQKGEKAPRENPPNGDFFVTHDKCPSELVFLLNLANSS